jgi:hypothetical protein
MGGRGNGRGLICIISPAFAWKDWGESRNLLHYSWTADLHLNPLTPEYEAGALCTRPWRSIPFPKGYNILWRNIYTIRAFEISNMTPKFLTSKTVNHRAFFWFAATGSVHVRVAQCRLQYQQEQVVLLQQIIDLFQYVSLSKTADIRQVH